MFNSVGPDSGRMQPPERAVPSDAGQLPRRFPFRMNFKMNAILERGQSKDALEQSSLHWTEQGFCVKNPCGCIV